MSSVAWGMLYGGVLVMVLQRNRMCTYVYREVYFKELAHIIVQA